MHSNSRWNIDIIMKSSIYNIQAAFRSRPFHVPHSYAQNPAFLPVPEGSRLVSMTRMMTRWRLMQLPPSAQPSGSGIPFDRLPQFWDRVVNILSPFVLGLSPGMEPLQRRALSRGLRFAV